MEKINASKRYNDGWVEKPRKIITLSIKEYIQEAVNLNMDIIEKLNTYVILIPRIEYKELYKIND